MFSISYQKIFNIFFVNKKNHILNNRDMSILTYKKHHNIGTLQYKVAF